jgi:hypothetical protein
MIDLKLWQSEPGDHSPSALLQTAKLLSRPLLGQSPHRSRGDAARDDQHDRCQPRTNRKAHTQNHPAQLPASQSYEGNRNSRRNNHKSEEDQPNFLACGDEPLTNLFPSDQSGAPI